MQLDDAQKQKVASWLEEGLKLSEIQNRIEKEFGLRMTYMEVRFLLDDLKLKPKDPEPEPAPAAEEAVGAQQTPTPEEPAPALGGVSVTVDQVTRPGALVSGKVTFSDGNAAEWYLDQYGRLGVASKQQGYKPSQKDLMEFQAKLQSEMAKLGY